MNEHLKSPEQIKAENLDIKTRLRIHITKLHGGEILTEEQQQVVIKSELNARVEAMLAKEENERVEAEQAEKRRQELGFGGWA